jgi:hypothetical protein
MKNSHGNLSKLGGGVPHKSPVGKYLKIITNPGWESGSILDWRLEGERFKSSLDLRHLCVVNDMKAYKKFFVLRQ